LSEYRRLDDPEHLEVRSSEHGARLTLRPNRGRLLAEFDAPGVSAATEVYLLGGCDGLGLYWSELAEDWRGWEGVRSWRSLEGDLELSATSDSLGHVSLEVRLEEGAPPRWRLEGTLQLEAGGLDRLAARARAFCGLFGEVA
jgi:hypothetical protein